MNQNKALIDPTAIRAIQSRQVCSSRAWTIKVVAKLDRMLRDLGNFIISPGTKWRYFEN